VPAEVLTDNAKQFTGRFTKPRPAEVLCASVSMAAFSPPSKAETAVDAFVAEYNVERPHEGIDDAYPADRFRSVLSDVDVVLPAVRVPAGLTVSCSACLTGAGRARHHGPPTQTCRKWV
jgi:hypothetical protein